MYFPDDIEDLKENIIGNKTQKERLEDFFNALDNFEEFKDKLKNTKLAPKFTMLLYGPPGTGKTSLTKAYAKEYNIPICIVQAHRLVSSLLGDTIKNLSQVVKVAADIAEKNKKFVLFFDEIDAVGSERSNVHEVGEIKRAVISFLQTIDEIKKDVPLAIFGATNHQNQLDSAIWRRFTFHLEFDFPDFNLRKKIIENFLKQIKDAKIQVDLTIYDKLEEEYDKINSLAKNIKDKFENNTSDLNEILITEIKLNNEIDGLLSLTDGYSGSDIERGTNVALFKAIGSYHDISLSYEMLYESLKLVGGTAVHVEQQDELSTTVHFDSNSKNLKDNFELLSYEDLLNEIPNLIPVIEDVFEILKNKKDLKTEYFTGNKKLGEFINILIEMSKLLKTRNILKFN